MKRMKIGYCALKVPKKMEQSRPKAYKVMGMEAYYKKHKHFYGSIVVTQNLEILDGYVIYYTAKKNGIKQVPIEIVSASDRIKHFFKKLFRKVGT